MKTIKIISGGLNNSYSEIDPTSVSAAGKKRSLKKDGTFITGRDPYPEELGELWRYSLTSKEKVNKTDMRLFSRLYVPEEGVDLIDDSNRNKIGLYDHIINHKNCSYYKTVIENGVAVKKQSNPNFVRNHLLYFEVIDETAIEEKRYTDSRLETKYRAIIDTAYDENQTGGRFIAMCYGCGIVKPERNTPIQNYNLMVNKLQINAENFALYYEDVDRNMVDVIQKAMKVGAEENVPYITQNGSSPYFFNNTAIGKNMDEMKLHFKQHEKEYEWLRKVVNTENIAIPVEAVGKVKEVIKQVVPAVSDEVTPRPKDTELKNNYDGMDSRVKTKMAQINTELGLSFGLYKKAKKDSNEKGITSAKNRMEKLKTDYPNEVDYINKKFSEKAIEAGVSL